jgi:hypothetical protein
MYKIFIKKLYQFLIDIGNYHLLCKRINQELVTNLTVKISWMVVSTTFTFLFILSGHSVKEYVWYVNPFQLRDCHDCDRMEVGFTTTCAISA